MEEASQVASFVQLIRDLDQGDLGLWDIELSPFTVFVGIEEDGEGAIIDFNKRSVSYPLKLKGHPVQAVFLFSRNGFDLFGSGMSPARLMQHEFLRVSGKLDSLVAASLFFDFLRSLGDGVVKSDSYHLH